MIGNYLSPANCNREEATCHMPDATVCCENDTYQIQYILSSTIFVPKIADVTSIEIFEH